MALCCGPSRSHLPRFQRPWWLGTGSVSVNLGRSIVTVTAGGLLVGTDRLPAAAVSGLALGRNGTLYLGVAGNLVDAVGPNGTLLWSYRASGEVNTTPSIDGAGTIYFGDASGRSTHSRRAAHLDGS